MLPRRAHDLLPDQWRWIVHLLVLSVVLMMAAGTAFAFRALPPVPLCAVEETVDRTTHMQFRAWAYAFLGRYARAARELMGQNC